MKIDGIRYLFVFFLVVVILLQFIHVLDKYQKISDKRRFTVDYVLMEKHVSKWGSCVGQLPLLLFFVPRCDRYLLGDMLHLSGRVDVQSAKDNLFQKRLIVEEISSSHPPRYSGIYILSKMLSFSQALKAKVLALFDMSYAGAYKTVAEAFVFGQLSLLSAPIVQQLNATGGHFLFSHGVSQFVFFLFLFHRVFRARILKKFAGVVFVPITVAYVLISGFSVSQLRNVFLYGIYFLLSAVVKRQIHRGLVFFWLVSLFLLFAPQLLFDTTFLMSILLVTLYMVLVGRMTQLTRKARYFKRNGKRILRSILFFFALLPITVLQRSSLQFLPLLFLPFLYVFWPILICTCLIFIGTATFIFSVAYTVSYILDAFLSLFINLNQLFASQLSFLNFSLTSRAAMCIFFILYSGVFIFIWCFSRQPKHSYRLY